MQEMAFHGFKFQTFSGGECSRTPSGKPPPPLTNQARSARDVNFPVRLLGAVGLTCRGGSSLNCKEGCRFSMGWCTREPYCPLSSAACNATIPTLPLFEMAESACSPFCYVLRFAAVTNYNLQAASTFLTTFLKQ